MTSTEWTHKVLSMIDCVATIESTVRVPGLIGIETKVAFSFEGDEDSDEALMVRLRDSCAPDEPTALPSART